MTEAGIPVYQITQVTYRKTGDSLLFDDCLHWCFVLYLLNLF